MGVSSEIGSCAILSNFADLGDGNVHAPGNLFARGSRPAPASVGGWCGMSLLMVRIMCRECESCVPGPRWRGDSLLIHHVAIGRELVAAAVFELVTRFIKADVALLNQVEELQAAVGVLLGDGNHEAQVGFRSARAWPARHPCRLDHFALGALELEDGDAGVALDFSRSTLQFFC